MIEWISNWAGGVIVAVIIGTIIEMILPDGNSKKYIKMVIGVYILFTIVSPVITKFTGNSVEVSDELDLDTYIEEAKENIKLHNTLEENNQQNIMSMYVSGIKDDMKAKIESKGYKVNNIKLDISNDETYTINSIEVEVEKIEEGEEENDDSEDYSKNNQININIVDKVDKVNIGSDNEKVSNSTKENNSNEEDKSNDKKNNLSNREIKELKEYLSSVYEVNENNITIN